MNAAYEGNGKKPDLKQTVTDIAFKKETNKDNISALTEYEQYLVQNLAALKVKSKSSKYKLC